MPVALVVVLSACGDSGGPGDVPGLQVVSGDGVTDTIGAELRAPLVVRLLDDAGEPLADREIIFEPRECLPYYSLCSAYVGPVEGTGFGLGLVDSTDGNGYVQARVKLGYRAGEGRIRITASETQQVATATYTVAPGRAAAMRATPRDSTLYVGASYDLEGGTFDGAGNPREGDPLSYARVDGPIEVTSGGRVSATGIGRARVAARSGELADTVALSVVPGGHLALTLRADATEVRTVELDGSGLAIVSASGWYDGGRPAWAGQLLVFVEGGGGLGATLRVADGGGASHRLAPASAATDEQLPRASRDGAWIYFRYTGAPAPGPEVWRVHPDGSGLERAGPEGTAYQSDNDPDPSPDGGMLAYSTTRPDGISRIVLRTLAGGAETPLGVPGRLPRWSPAGDWLAYLRSDNGYDGVVHLIRPDGTGDHQLSAEGRRYFPAGLDWSSDGNWMIARGESTLELLPAGGGAPLPLGWSAGYDWPAWRPQ